MRDTGGSGRRGRRFALGAAQKALHRRAACCTDADASGVLDANQWASYCDFMRFGWGALMVNQYSGPMGDPVWLNNRTVLEHYQLKNYKDSASINYTWYKPTVVRACKRSTPPGCVHLTHVTRAPLLW